MRRPRGRERRRLRTSLNGEAYLARLFKITDSDVPTPYYYAMLYMTRGRPTENQMNVLLRAQSLAPQVLEIGINTAQMLILEKRYQEAENILKPIVGVGVGVGGAAVAARRMLDELPVSSPPH